MTRGQPSWFHNVSTIEVPTEKLNELNAAGEQGIEFHFPYLLSEKISLDTVLVIDEDLPRSKNPRTLVFRVRGIKTTENREWKLILDRL
jgi:hypothetical protein